MHVNLFNTIDDVVRNLVHEEISQTTVTENGVLEVDMSGVVLVMNLVAIDEAYNGAVEKLKEYSTYAKWVNDAYTVKLTPTPFKPIPTNVKAFAQFNDTDENELCNTVFAMSKIQACDGVETRDFAKLASNRIQVCYLFIFLYFYLFIYLFIFIYVLFIHSFNIYLFICFFAYKCVMQAFN